jgi:hypothetical protein
MFIAQSVCNDQTTLTGPNVILYKVLNLMTLRIGTGRAYKLKARVVSIFQIEVTPQLL